MDEPTYDQIIAARDQCAKIVALYGQQYLPIFERLEREIARHEEQRKMLKRALRISQEIGTRNGTQNGTQIEPRKREVTEIFNKISALVT